LRCGWLDLRQRHPCSAKIEVVPSKIIHPLTTIKEELARIKFATLTLALAIHPLIPIEVLPKPMLLELSIL
jgi:hypothetical protein